MENKVIADSKPDKPIAVARTWPSVEVTIRMDAQMYEDVKYLAGLTGCDRKDGQEVCMPLTPEEFISECAESVVADRRLAWGPIGISETIAQRLSNSRKPQ